MIPLAGAGVGLLAAVGIVLVVAAVRGGELPALSRPTVGASGGRRFDGRWLAGGAVVGLVVGLVTQVVAAGLLATAVVVAVPLFRQARVERAVVVDRTEALASWAESLRDQVRSFAGLRQAIAMSVPTAGDAIRSDVALLAQDLETESPETAFGRFAERVGDPVGDLLATALTVALGESGASDIPKLLGRLASDARDEVTGIRQIAVKHEKTFSTVRSMVMVVAAITTVMFGWQGEFMAQYASVQGQVVLVFIVVVVIAGLVSLVRMARPVRPIRVLSGAIS